MTKTERLRNELDVASRITENVNDPGSARELRRYIHEIEAKLASPRPKGDVMI